MALLQPCTAWHELHRKTPSKGFYVPFFDFTAFEWLVVDLFYRGKVFQQQQVRVIILLVHTIFKERWMLCWFILFSFKQRLLGQWRHPRGGRGGYGALAPPIFGIPISKTTKLAPNIWQKVCLAPQSIFSPSKTKCSVTPLFRVESIQKTLSSKWC